MLAALRINNTDRLLYLHSPAHISSLASLLRESQLEKQAGLLIKSAGIGIRTSIFRFLFVT